MKSNYLLIPYFKNTNTVHMQIKKGATKINS